ncbi:MAG: hypothetical protein AAF414_20250 [Pseudomonadota bacterium]
MATTSINLDNLDGTNGFKFGGSQGSRVALIGDVNGDTFEDVAISHFGAANGGATYIIYGSSDPFDSTITPETVDVTIVGGVAGIQSGFSISRVGDFNGDGVDDFFLGAPAASPDGRTSAGQSYLVFGVDDADGGLPAQIDLSQLDGTDGFALNGETGQTGQLPDADYRPPDLSGYAVSATDVNADGLMDLLIGGPQGPELGASTDPDEDFSGIAYVVYGTSDAMAPELELSSLDGTNGFKIEGQVPGGSVGFSIAGAGDLNGDGFEEIIVGSPQNGRTFETGGGVDVPTYAYIIYGSETPATSIDLTNPGSQPDNVVIITGDQDNYSHGIAVSGAGDINGDGFDDVIVGSWPALEQNISVPNAAAVVFGSANPSTSPINLTQLDGTDGFNVTTGFNSRFTPWLSSAGDVNNDGFDDVLVGQPEANGNDGAAYLIFGTDQGFPSVIDAAQLDGTDGLILDLGADPSTALGASVGGRGDVNGDGIADFVVSAGGNGQDRPSAYVVLGSEDLADAVGFNFEGDEDNDVFVGKSSSDRAFGGAGRDLLIGRDDDDFLFGGPDNDKLFGGKDDDVLRGGLGRDLKVGGRGDDTYAGTAEELDGDRIIGFSPGDKIVIDSFDFDVEVEKKWFGSSEISFDTDGNGSLDGSLKVYGVFGRRDFEVEQVGDDTVISLGEPEPFGSFFSSFFDRIFDGWDFF